MTYILEKIKNTLEQLDSSLGDIVRTRIFTTDISKWQEIAKAHHEYFQGIEPTTTIIEISKFIVPDMLVEVEVDAEVVSK